MKHCSIEDRIFQKMEMISDCWVWRGTLVHGYGVLYFNNKLRYLHRISYQLFVSDLDNDLEIDHLCRNRACFNPEHLEQVTHQENMARAFPYSKVLIGDMQRAKTHCLYGHPFNHKNTHMSSTGRQCRTCHRDKERIRRAKAKLC